MVSGDNVTVTLTGGAPWGFRLTGGGAMPLEISKIRKKSQAHAQGLREGDAVVSINGTPVHDRSHDQALELIEQAGATLTLQIYRGDADDLGQVLASNKPAPTLAPLLPPGAKERSPTVTSSASSVATHDDGHTQRRVTHDYFVQQEGGVTRQTFVRKEEIASASSTSRGGGEVRVVDGEVIIPVDNIITCDSFNSGMTSLTSSQSKTSQAVIQLQPTGRPGVQTSPQRLSPAVSPKPVSPAVSPKPVSPAVSPKPERVKSPAPPVATSSPCLIVMSPTPVAAPKPSFKAVPPPVGPKPSLGPQVPPKPTFKAAPPPGVTVFSPSKFQVSASAMCSPAGQPPQVQTVQRQTQWQQQLTVQQQPGTRQQVYSANLPKAYSPGVQQGDYSHGGKTPPAPFSPLSISSPLSPPTPSLSFSPSSAGSGAMFTVRNNVGRGQNLWQPNMWLPGQEPDHSQQQQPQSTQHQPARDRPSENIEVPPRMSVKERQQLLLRQAENKHALSARQMRPPDFQQAPEEEPDIGHMHVFGPPVEFTPWGPRRDSGGEELALVRTDSVESAPSSPGSSLSRRKKKLYSDSAFYEDAEHKYPTIQEQMKLCRLISQSLTSAANRKARGAKMFARRKRRSTKWVHEGQSEWSSSAGDVANLEELDSDLSADEGGSKALFTFRIPRVKHRVSSPERNTKMSLKKDEFERLRLQAAKCDHTAVSPGTCFDIAAGLKASKGRAGRLFERRKNRADKFIIDETNARTAPPQPTKLEDLLKTPLKSQLSPWQAAQSDDAGRVDAAFDHLTDVERMQKLNQMLKYSAPKPAVSRDDLLQPPPPSGPHADLRSTCQPQLVKGRNFNRVARGWLGGADDGERSASPSHHVTSQPASRPASAMLEPAAQLQYGDYNPRPKAWQGPQLQGNSSSCPPSMSTSWASSDFEVAPISPQTPVYPADLLPATDL